MSESELKQQLRALVAERDALKATISRLRADLDAAHTQLYEHTKALPSIQQSSYSVVRVAGVVAAPLERAISAAGGVMIAHIEDERGAIVQTEFRSSSPSGDFSLKLAIQLIAGTQIEHRSIPG